MNTFRNTALSIALGALIGATSTLPAEAGNRFVSASSTVSEQTEADLTFMREEEKLARDVYLTLGEQWQLAVFDNIAESEQRHMDSVENLLDKYEIEDPVLDESTLGDFTNPDLQSLYEDLLEDGAKSATDALMVGALIEEVDINDLLNALDTETATDVRKVYENLLRGSRNHLRAFVGKLENEGIVYEAQVLSQDEVDDIIDSPTERGRPRKGRR